MSTLKVNRIEPRTGDSVEIVGFEAPTTPVKAWVNFNGIGTVAIRDSMNVSSITDNGVGNFTVNFTTAFSDTNYATLLSCVGIAGMATERDIWNQGESEATTYAKVQFYRNVGQYDPYQVSVACIGD